MIIFSAIFTLRLIFILILMKFIMFNFLFHVFFTKIKQQVLKHKQYLLVFSYLDKGLLDLRSFLNPCLGNRVGKGEYFGGGILSSIKSFL